MNEAPLQSRAIFQLEGIMNFFLRVLSLIFICFAIRYWFLLVGAWEANIRFDTMPNHWKVASTFFAVSYPVAALGLWGLSRWGVVVWFLVASVEVGLHFFYSEIFEEYPSLIMFHLISMAIWLIYILIEYLDKKRALIQKSR